MDKAGYPTMTNADALAAIADESWATELGKFNIELAADPRCCSAAACSRRSQSSLGGIVDAGPAERVEPSGTRLVMIGILPSLREADVDEECIVL